MRYGKLKYAYVAAALGVSGIGADYIFMREAVQAQVARPPAVSNIGVASRLDDLQSVAKQTAAVVEAWVSEISYDYSEERGPWTTVKLSNVHAHFGEAPASFEIRHFGGPLPDGRTIVIAELPVFVRGKEYVLFLRSGGWNVSPVVGDYALRVEKIDNKEVLVNSDGQAVTEVTSRGVDVGPTLFDGFELNGAAPKALVDEARAVRAPAAGSRAIRRCPRHHLEGKPSHHRRQDRRPPARPVQVARPERGTRRRRCRPEGPQRQTRRHRKGCRRFPQPLIQLSIPETHHDQDDDDRSNRDHIRVPHRHDRRR